METLFPIGLPASGAAWATATGGTVTEPGDGYRYHTFLGPTGTLTVTSAGMVEHLIVDGGGGGARGTFNRANGSGAAGGLRTNDGQENHAVTTQDYPIVVGAGGARGTALADGNSGAASSFDGLTGVGGGGGGFEEQNGLPGGSGGGGGGSTVSGPTGGAGTPGLGFAGGDGVGGGRGGAGGGKDGAGVGRTHGPGLEVWGTTYARGGVDSGDVKDEPRVDEPANTGNGGRGGWNNDGAAGGSGKVIIRYKI